MYNDLLLDRLVAHEEDQDQRIDELIQEIEELESLIGPEAHDLIAHLRPHTVTDDVYEDLAEDETFGERLAGRAASFVGSWVFILSFCLMMVVWMGLNVAMGASSFDPYPFILLNLTLSTLAALQAPMILMSQNRQSEKDRAVARNDYQVNLKNELELADLHHKMDELNMALLNQTRLVNALVAARRQEVAATIRMMEKARKEIGFAGESVTTP